MQTLDPDQISHFAASDLGVHCLPVFLLWDARLKWVKVQYKHGKEVRCPSI